MIETTSSKPAFADGLELRAKRMERGLSQQDLANQLDVSIAMVSHWENGRRPINKMQSMAIEMGILRCK